MKSEKKVQDIARRLEEAVRLRETLSLNTDALRLVNGRGDGLGGLVIDRFHKHFAVYIFDSLWHAYKETVAGFLQKHFDVDYLVFKDRTAAAADITPDRVEVFVDGRDSRTVVEENGLRFQVDLNDRLNPGLFLDMRKNRKRVASGSRGKKVLNGFAYTCSFGVYCRKFGAASVVNVDISPKALKRGEENYALNGLTPDKDEFARASTGQYMLRAVKRDNFFDVIILDPPSFSRHEGKVFSVKKDMPALIEQALRILSPRGTLFVSTNLSTISLEQMEAWAFAAAGKCRREIGNVQRLSQDRDFSGSGAMKESSLSALLLSV